MQALRDGVRRVFFVVQDNKGCFFSRSGHYFDTVENAVLFPTREKAEKFCSAVMSTTTNQNLNLKVLVLTLELSNS